MKLSRLSPLSALIPAIHADCFSHDGIQAQDSKFYTGPELISCGNGTNNCCMEGQKCGTNLLCVDGGGGVSRQYCSTPSWDGCSDICPGGEHAGVALLDCGDNIYCCQSGSTERDCCVDERAFYVDPDNGMVVQTIVPARTKPPRWFAVDTLATLASVSTPSTSSSTPTRISTLSSTTSVTESSIPNPTFTNPPDVSSKKISPGIGAGIGIGVVAGVVMIGAAMWLLLRRRKRNTSMGATGEGSGYATSASVDEKPGAKQTYYSHDEPSPRELDGVQLQTQELDGGGQNTARYELDGTGSKLPLGL